MSASRESLPARFDVVAYEAQIKNWIKEGHAEGDIFSQAAITWPELPAGYTQATLDHFQRRLQKRRARTPEQALRHINRQRARHLRFIEKKLGMDDTPISMHSLYRGILRDQEAACHKLIQVAGIKQSQDEKQARKLEMQELTRQCQELKSRGNEIINELQQQYPQMEDHGRQLIKPRSTVASLGCLIGFIVSLFLAGCSGSARTPASILYTVPTPHRTQQQANTPLTQRATMHGHRQRTTQLFALSAEDHQALLQRAAHDSA